MQQATRTMTLSASISNYMIRKAYLANGLIVKADYVSRDSVHRLRTFASDFLVGNDQNKYGKSATFQSYGFVSLQFC